MTKERQPLHIQAARVCFAAPFVAGILGIMTATAIRDSRTTGLVIAAFQALLLLGGLVAGVVALTGISKHGAKAILGRVIAGFVITGLIIWIAAGSFHKARANALKNREIAREQEGQRLEQQGMDSFLDYPGWYGIAQTGDVLLVATSLSDDSPSAKTLNGDLGVNVSIAQVSLVNQSPNTSVTVDSARARMQMTDGTVGQCLALADVLRSAKNDKEKMVQKFLGPHTVPPQSQLPTVFIYTPFGFPWNDVASVTVTVDGVPVVIEGQMLSAKEKTELVEAGRRAQEQQQNN